MVEQDIEFITFDGDTITKSDIRDRIIDMYIQSNIDGLTKITDFTVGSEARHLADLIATFVLEHREDIDNNYKMTMVHYAEGEFLDNMGDKAGVHRYQSSPSTGNVTFTLKSAKEDLVTIPADTVVATDDAISFILTEDINIQPGTLTGNGQVLCEQEGEYTNVLPGTVNIIISELGINGLTVTNDDYFYDGADIEEDDDYRARILNAPGNVPTGSLRWFGNVAMDNEDVRSTVHDVIVRKNVPGYTEDIIMYFRPFHPEENRAYTELTDLFNEPEFDMVGISMAFVQGEPVTVLPESETVEGDEVTYLYAIVVDDDVELDDIKDDIEAAIIEFNSNSSLGEVFSPDSLALEIENVEGVFRCRIVKYNSTEESYSEVTDNSYNVPCLDNEYYEIDTTNISDRITEASFSIDLRPSNGE